MVSKRALLLLADDAEEMEAVISIDVMRRAKIDVTVAGLSLENVNCSRGVVIKPDKSVLDVKDQIFDIVVLPGGLGGSKKLAESAEVKEILSNHNKVGNYIAAICAAPTALAAHDIAKGKRITSYPSLQSQLEKDYAYSDKRVVQDGNIITSRGPGTAFEFALTIVGCLTNQQIVEQLKQEMLFQ